MRSEWKSAKPWTPAGMDKRGHLPSPLWKCWTKCLHKVFLCISGYSKTLSRRIIYALFSQPVVGFWGFYPDPTRIYPWTPLGDFCLQTPNLPTPGKNSAGAQSPMCEANQRPIPAGIWQLPKFNDIAALLRNRINLSGIRPKTAPK